MDYAIHTDVRYGPLQRIDAGALADACTDPWWNQTLCRVAIDLPRGAGYDPAFHSRGPRA